MDNNEFAILHQLNKTQFLVNTEYDSENEQFRLSVKFWVDKMNGFVTVTMVYAEDKKDAMKDKFDELKDIKKAEQLYKKFNQ